MTSPADLAFVDGVPAAVREGFARATEVFSERHVCHAVDQLAVHLTVDLMDRNPILLAVLHGGLFFTGMIMQRVVFPLEQGYVHVGRYDDQKSGGALVWHGRDHPNLTDRTVLLIDDVLDRGVTLAALEDWAREEGANDVRSAVLVHKDVDGVDFRSRYAALECRDRFLIGCGMDFAGYGRNLPGIFAID